jgi:hypothetical protein
VRFLKAKGIALPGSHKCLLKERRVLRFFVGERLNFRRAVSSSGLRGVRQLNFLELKK